MQRATDSTDTPTLSNGLNLLKSLTSVGRTPTVSVTCRLSVIRSVGKVSVCGVKLGECKVSVKR